MPPPMLAVRLPFLYPPALRRAFSSSRSASTGTAARAPPARIAASAHLSRVRCLRHGQHLPRRTAPQLRRRFSQSTSRCRAAFMRHGKAVEPLPPLSDDKRHAEPAPSGTPAGATKPGAGKESHEPGKEASVSPSPGTGSTELTPTTYSLASNASDSSSSSSSSSSPTTPHAVQETKAEAKMSGPMQAVLHMGPPRNGRHGGFAPMPYMHHFDTYTLVKQLREGGYSKHQSITAMKAIRSLLAENLEVAQGTLVSKIDAENETYLFRAACSELGAEVKNNRRVADENMRQQRILLQHEVDILAQTLNQELLTLNDNVRGMFNDRRMTVREEQRTTEAAIQQLAYQISIGLSSEAKSEIESLRWILIRRSVLGIIFMAVLTLGTLRYATYVSHEKQKEMERRRLEKERQWRHDGTNDQSTSPDAAVILAAS